MNHHHLPLYILFFLILVFIPQLPASAPNIDRMIVFGDSLSDTGRALKISGMKPPANSPYYGGRASNGPLWVEYIARDLGVTFNHNDNYALAGATSGNRLSPEHPIEAGFLGQLQLFEASLKSKPVSLDSTLILVLVGGNDFQANIPPEQTAQNIATGLKKLEQLGAQKIVIGNIPPAHMSPLAGKATQDQQKQWAQAVAQTNTLLSQQIAQWMKDTQVEVCALNTIMVFEQIAADPSRFGFQDIQNPVLRPTNPTLAGADQSFWWDDFHPTTKGHRVLSQAVMARLPASWKAKTAPKAPANR